jgi:peptidoglycan hydrolase-like protein with peptidoglycan-binding domain
VRVIAGIVDPGGTATLEIVSPKPSFLLFAALGAVIFASAASAAPTRPAVHFTRGEQLATVERPATSTPLASALRALIAGPTQAERAQGFSTEIPAATKFRGVVLRKGVAYVDLTRAFESGGGSASMFARLSQLVYTGTAVDGVKSVRLLLDGKRVAYIGGEGVIVDHPLTRGTFAPKPQGATPRPAPTRNRPSALVTTIQERLGALGYLPSSTVDGVYGARTQNAILAFQSWEGLKRDGLATQSLRTDLASAERPTPSPRTGRRIEVSLKRQVALLVDADGSAVRAIHVSSGSSATPTPAGAYRVFRKELKSWSVPFQSWLPYASYFAGGIAFHEYADVPTFPASHGCVRVPSGDAPEVYAFAKLGTAVYVA